MCNLEGESSLFVAKSKSTSWQFLVVITNIKLPLSTAALAASSCKILPSGLNMMGDSAQALLPLLPLLLLMPSLKGQMHPKRSKRKPINDANESFPITLCVCLLGNVVRPSRPSTVDETDHQKLALPSPIVLLFYQESREYIEFFLFHSNSKNGKEKIHTFILS